MGGGTRPERAWQGEHAPRACIMGSISGSGRFYVVELRFLKRRLYERGQDKKLSFCHNDSFMLHPARVPRGSVWKLVLNSITAADRALLPCEVIARSVACRCASDSWGQLLPSRKPRVEVVGLQY